MLALFVCFAVQSPNCNAFIQHEHVVACAIIGPRGATAPSTYQSLKRGYPDRLRSACSTHGGRSLCHPHCMRSTTLRSVFDCSDQHVAK